MNAVELNGNTSTANASNDAATTGNVIAAQRRNIDQGTRNSHSSAKTRLTRVVLAVAIIPTTATGRIVTAMTGPIRFGSNGLFPDGYASDVFACTDMRHLSSVSVGIHHRPSQSACRTFDPETPRGHGLQRFL